MSRLFYFMMPALFLFACGETKEGKEGKPASKHHLNMPATGIHSLMESNTQKILEGTDGSVLLQVGEVTRKQADISIRRGDRILEERLLGEKESLKFAYEDHSYTLTVRNIKKPLLGAGKVELVIE